MTQFFAHMPWKGKKNVGNVTRHETHERRTVVQIGGSELADLLADFACERSGLPRSAIKKIELSRNVYAADSLDQTLVVIFMEELEVDGGQKQ